MFRKGALCQGTTLVVPQDADNKGRALAPRFPPISPEIKSFSAACLGPEQNSMSIYEVMLSETW
jgi:hypothetical protein